MNSHMPPLSASLTLSERAAARIVEIMAEYRHPETVALRVSVLSGGCNGFQYIFKLDHERAADDAIIERSGATVIVDPMSLELLAGAELDYEDKLMGAHFIVRNPHAASTCGCGSSFSLA